MLQNGVNFQLVLPHPHRTNTAEQAIQSYKDHLFAGLSSYYPNFPLQLWDHLLHQVTLTLNLLCPSRINPHLLEESQLNGPFNFNRSPLAPPGTKFLVYEDPTNGRTWAPHSFGGWYIGIAIEHCRCYRVYIPATRAERIAQTVHYFLLPALCQETHLLMQLLLLPKPLPTPLQILPLLGRSANLVMPNSMPSMTF